MAVRSCLEASNAIFDTSLTYPSPLYYISTEEPIPNGPSPQPKLHIEPKPHIEGEEGHEIMTTWQIVVTLVGVLFIGWVNYYFFVAGRREGRS